jgi:hypothetical protein
LLLRHDEENDTTERAETKYCYIFFTGTATLALGTCFSFMRMWEELNGGWARVSLYSPLLDGVGYVLKGCDAEYQRRWRLLRGPKVRWRLRRHAFRVDLPRFGRAGLLEDELCPDEIL